MMITFKIIATQFEIEQLKTRAHHKTHTLHECVQSNRLGYISEMAQTFDKEGTQIKSSQSIKSFYFGFPNTAQAEKFEDFIKYKFPDLAAYSTHCESRLSKRLKSPFEVKVRNLDKISDALFAFFCQCVDKELSPKVLEISEYEADMRRKVKRL